LRVEGEHEVSKSSFSPLLDTATHRRAKTGVDFLQTHKEPLFHKSATKPYEGNSSYSTYEHNPIKVAGEIPYNGYQNYRMDTIEERNEDSVLNTKKSLDSVSRLGILTNSTLFIKVLCI